MIWPLILLTMGIALCAGIYQAMEDAKRARPKCYLASEDDAAIHEHERQIEMRKVTDLRKQSEAIRRRYEGITWPAIRWAYQERQMQQHFTIKEMTA